MVILGEISIVCQLVTMATGNLVMLSYVKAMYICDIKKIEDPLQNRFGTFSQKTGQIIKNANFRRTSFVNGPLTI